MQASLNGLIYSSILGSVWDLRIVTESSLRCSATILEDSSFSVQRKSGLLILLWPSDDRFLEVDIDFPRSKLNCRSLSTICCAVHWVHGVVSYVHSSFEAIIHPVDCVICLRGFERISKTGDDVVRICSLLLHRITSCYHRRGFQFARTSYDSSFVLDARVLAYYKQSWRSPPGCSVIDTANDHQFQYVLFVKELGRLKQ